LTDTTHLLAADDPPGNLTVIAARRRSRAGVARVAVGVALAFALLMNLPGVTLGANAVSLSLRSPAVAVIGQEILISGSVKISGGLPPTGLRLLLSMNGTFVTSTHALPNGAFTFTIKRTDTSKAGTYALKAEFLSGSQRLTSAQATTTLKIRPAVVTVTTVPVVPGLPITLGGTTQTTDAKGEAKLSVAQVGPQTLETHIDQIKNPALRVSFIRWEDSVYSEKRTVNVRGDLPLVLGLRTAYRASVRFIDETGAAIDPKLISKFRATSSSGQELILTDFADSAWWESATAVSRSAGLQESTTLWRLAEVWMAGTNVVNQGQQAFTPTADGTWTVNLLLYDLVIRTSDAVTGGSLSGTAELVYPDSTSTIVPFAADGTATFHNLPRGLYTIRLKTDGMAPPTPVALSRTQGATIRVISYVDIALGVILALAMLVILLYIGRRRHIRGLAWAAAVPGRVIRSTVRRGPNAVRQRVPAARQTMSATMSDVAGVGRGPVAEAGRFVRDAIVAFARAVRRTVGSAIRGVGFGGRSRAPRRIPATDPAQPSWPVTEPRSDVAAALHPPVTTRPVAATANAARRVPTPAGATWFEVPADDEPTHDCSRCSRPVPDSARFCRSCGHRQF
jgi:hypothetical protein